MELLDSLRKHILDSPLGIKASDLVTFAKNGKIVSHQGAPDQSFGFEYQAHIIVIDYGKPPDILMFMVLNWLKKHQANHTLDPIQFEADILDHKKVDLELIMTLEEGVEVIEEKDGFTLKHHGISPIDIGKLDAKEWELYITPDPNVVADLVTEE